MPSRKRAGGKKPRDYKAEYARRIQRNLEKGLTRSQARGHARKRLGELSITERKRVKRAVESQGKRGVTGGLRWKVRGELAKQFSATNPAQFVASFIDAGLGSAHEAYSLYFSP